jgi:dienelactone hydrolase
VLSEPVPGPWASPLNPEEATAPATLNVLAFRPATAQPAGGYPVVIFGHGITRAKTDLFALASQLAAAGMASVAIDWPLHGDPAGPFGGRAVQIYPTGSACQTPGDTGLPDPTVSAACFAPILTANLPGTRDNLRQGAIDILRLIAVLKANCAATSASGGATCNGLVVDSTRIGYLGMSIGSLIGELPLGTTTDIKAAVLNVPATSLLTILENTDTLEIKCPLIDALINNGTLTGKVWQQPNGTFNTTDATCVTPDPHQPLSIVNDPGYKQFATAARWVLDPAESVNFLDRIAAKLAGGSMSLLLQEVRDDQVLPNEATSILGQFLGFTAPAEATTPTSATFTPSAGLSAKAAWLIYSPAATAVYAHSSILKPPPSSGVPGSLGTGQMQTDAVTYLATHLQ